MPIASFCFCFTLLSNHWSRCDTIDVSIYLFNPQVKSRMQNQLRVDGQILKYRYTVPSLITVTGEEGLAAVYK